MARFKCSSNKILFGIIFFLFILSLVLENTAWAVRPRGTVNEFSLFLKILRYIAYALSVVKILRDSYPLIWFWRIFLILSIIIFSIAGSKEKTYLVYMLIFLAAMGMSSQQLIKCSFTAQILVCAVILFCVSTKILDDYVWINGERIQHFLGFIYSNRLPGIYLFLLLQYIYLKKGKQGPQH